MKKLIVLIKKENSFLTKLLVTGTHFDKKFGNTYKEIIKDRIKIDYKINIKIKGDSAANVAKYFSKQSEKFNSILNRKFRPDLIILLGDRFEILSIASICKIYNIPICHIEIVYILKVDNMLYGPSARVEWALVYTGFPACNDAVKLGHRSDSTPYNKIQIRVQSISNLFQNPDIYWTLLASVYIKMLYLHY